MTVSNEWCIAVLKCTPQNLKDVLVVTYRFVYDLNGVRSLHFLVRDRVEDEVIVSFRIMVEPKFNELIKSKLNYKLGSLLPEDKFAINPIAGCEFERYVAWNPEKRLADFGRTKFNHFIDFLNNQSSIVIGLLENEYFSSDERTELAHVFSWMVGCAEYGKLSLSHMEIGYYDRIDDKEHCYLREDFSKNTK